MLRDKEEAVSLLSLDAGSLVHISHFLTSPRDLASLELCCTTLQRILQSSACWAHVLKLNYGGLQLRLAAPAAGAEGAGQPNTLPHLKGVCRLLHDATRDLQPVRFTAVFTDGGVDTGSIHYWADHMFIPNTWTPFCAKYSDNVTSLAVIKTGPEAYDELLYRNRLIGCLKWSLPLFQHQQPPPPAQPQAEPEHVELAAAMLADWKTPRLESLFTHLAGRLEFSDVLSRALLTGLSGGHEERRAAARAMVVAMRAHGNYYERAYRLHFMPQRSLPLAPPPLPPAPRVQVVQQQQQQGQVQATQRQPYHQPQQQQLQQQRAGRARDRRAETIIDNPYVMDEHAVQGELMTAHAASSVAILYGMAISREGRLSCPVLCGALLAGVLPAGWPRPAANAAEAVAAATEPGGSPDALRLLSYECIMRATLEQPYATALDDKQDAESVLAACEAGQLPPWVRHVVFEHAEYIEMLPPHLAPPKTQEVSCPGGPSAAVTAAAGVRGGSEVLSASLQASLPQLHPVLWFRFREHADYTRRRPTAFVRQLLRRSAELSHDAALLLSTPDCGGSGREGGEGGASVAGALVGLTLRDLQVEVDRVWGKGALGGPVSGAEAGPSSAGAAVSRGAWREEEDSGEGMSESGCERGEELQGEQGEQGDGEEEDDEEEEAEGDADVEMQPPASSPLTAAAAAAEEEEGGMHHTVAAASQGSAEEYGGAADGGDVSMPPGSDTPGGAAKQSTAAPAAGGAPAPAAPPVVHLPQDVSAALLQAARRAELTLQRLLSNLANILQIAPNLHASVRQHLPQSDLQAIILQEVEPSRAAMQEMVRQARRLDTAARALAMKEECGELSREASARSWRRTLGEVGWEVRRKMRRLAWSEVRRREWARVAAALWRYADAATAAAADRPPSAAVVTERRNEELLRRLPLAPPALAPAVGPGAGAAVQPPPPPLPGPQAVLEPPAPAGWAPPRLFDSALQADFEAGREQLTETDAHRVLHLFAPLLFPVAANAVAVKAVRPENLMEMVGWDDNTEPNVDVQYLGLQGRVVRLPPGVQAVPAV